MNTTKNFPLSLYLWPLLVTGALLTTIGAAIWTVRIALQNPVQLVESQPYEKGIHYNEVVEQIAEGKTFEAIEEVRYLSLAEDEESSPNKRLQVILRKNLTPLPKEVRLTLMRPNNPQSDRNELVLSPTPKTHLYLSPPITLEKGLWLIEIELLMPDEKTLRYRIRQYLS
ncbi:FixH family protein [bacterium]|nr:FixH family protein [bacterium]